MAKDTSTWKQHATYHLAPNFSIGPPPDGMLQLGSIIDDLKNPDAINEDDLVDIPQHKRHRDVKEGFVASRSSMKRGEFGIWAKAVGLEGLGGEVSAAHERLSEIIYRFESIETIYFSADTRYIAEAMNKQDVKDYIEGSGYEPVYMVTGLKIARGPAMKVNKSRNSEFSTGASIGQPEIVPVQLGANTSLAKGTSSMTEFERSCDFVIGIRVKKLRYKTRGWFSGKRELIVDKYDKGATLVGTNSTGSGEDELDVEEVPLEECLRGMTEFSDAFESNADLMENTLTTNWIVSNGRL